MSLLNFRDIKNATQTCYYWYILVQKSPRLQKKLVPKIKFKRTKLEPKNTNVIAALNSKREFKSIVLNYVTWTELYEEFWIQIGQNITQLLISNCRVAMSDLISIIKYLPRLQFLELSSNNFWNSSINKIVNPIANETALSYLSKLQGLRVTMIPQTIFFKLFSCVENLKIFIYENVQGPFSFDHRNLLGFIQRNSRTLEKLALFYDKTSVSMIERIANIEFLNLKSFETNNSNFEFEIFEKFCLRFPNIKNFECYDAKGWVLKCAISSWRNLNKLSINGCDCECLNQLMALRRIESLHLFNVGEVDNGVLIGVLKSIDPNLLKSFIFEGLITDSDLKWITENLVNLKQLKLSLMRPIPLIGIQMIFKNSLNLEVLALSRWSWYYVSALSYIYFSHSY